MRPWSGRVLLTSKKLGSSGLICPDINPASHAFLATVPWCCYSIPHGTFKSTFCIDLPQFSQCWTVLGWHSGDSDGPFGGSNHCQFLVPAALHNVVSQTGWESTLGCARTSPTKPCSMRPQCPWHPQA